MRNPERPATLLGSSNFATRLLEIRNAKFGYGDRSKVMATIRKRDTLLREMLVGKPIQQAVKDLVEIYLFEGWWDFADEINNGACWDFADDLAMCFPTGIATSNIAMCNIDINEHEESWAHAFFFYQDKYYDSECPEGVEDWRNLPCCQRCLEDEAA